MLVSHFIVERQKYLQLPLQPPMVVPTSGLDRYRIRLHLVQTTESKLKMVSVL